MYLAVLGNFSIEVRPSLQVWLKLCPNCERFRGQGRNTYMYFLLGELQDYRLSVFRGVQFDTIYNALYYYFFEPLERGDQI